MNAIDLHWTECKLEKIEVSNNDLIVWADNVIYPEINASYKVKVTFLGVIESNRKVSEYIGEPKGNPNFKEMYTIEDMPKQNAKGAFETYYIENITLFEPISWLDWEIKAIGSNVTVL